MRVLPACAAREGCKPLLCVIYGKNHRHDQPGHSSTTLLVADLPTRASGRQRYGSLFTDTTPSQDANLGIGYPWSRCRARQRGCTMNGMIARRRLLTLRATAASTAAATAKPRKLRSLPSDLPVGTLLRAWSFSGPSCRDRRLGCRRSRCRRYSRRRTQSSSLHELTESERVESRAYNVNFLTTRQHTFSGCSAQK